MLLEYACNSVSEITYSSITVVPGILKVEWEAEFSGPSSMEPALSFAWGDRPQTFTIKNLKLFDKGYS